MKSHLDAKKTEQHVANNKKKKYGESDVMIRILPHRKAKENNITPNVKHRILSTTDFKKKSGNKGRDVSQRRCSGNDDARALKSVSNFVQKNKETLFTL